MTRTRAAAETVDETLLIVLFLLVVVVFFPSHDTAGNRSCLPVGGELCWR